MKHKIRQLIGVAGMLLLIGAGCLGKSMPSEPVSIGLMVPLSGDVASFGENVRRGVELALEDAGLEHVAVHVEDSQCDPTEATNAINALIATYDVAAVVGEICSGATLAAAPIAEEQQVVLVSPASSAPTITDAGDYIFRVFPSDAIQAEFGAELVYTDGKRRLAILYMTDDYGTGYEAVLQEEFPRRGGQIVASEGFRGGSTDVRAQLTKIRAANPDALFVISNSPDSSVVALQQARELGLDLTIYGVDALNSPDIVSGAGGAAEGLVVATARSANKAFADRYEQRFGEQPAFLVGHGYDAMSVLLDAVADGARTGEEIKSFLDEYSFDGATGNLSFDENGDIVGGREVYIVENGEFVVR